MRRLAQALNRLMEWALIGLLAGMAGMVLLNVVQGLVFGVPAVVSAWFVTRRHAWARWAGVATCGLLALLTVWTSVAAGGVAVTSLLLIVLCMGAVSSLLAATTATWTQTGARSRG